MIKPVIAAQPFDLPAQPQVPLGRQQILHQQRALGEVHLALPHHHQFLGQRRQKMALPRPWIPEDQNVLFPIQKAAFQQRPQLPCRFRRQPLQIEVLQRLLQRQRRVFQQPLHLATSAAARIPARSPPADTAHSSASLVPPAAPSLRSTPAPSAGANPSGAPSAPGVRRPPRSLPHLHLQCITGRSWPGPPAPLPPSSPAEWCRVWPAVRRSPPP